MILILKVFDWKTFFEMIGQMMLDDRKNEYCQDHVQQHCLKNFDEENVLVDDSSVRHQLK
jgi:hypothetical protein